MEVLEKIISGEVEYMQASLSSVTVATNLATKQRRLQNTIGY